MTRHKMCHVTRVILLLVATTLFECDCIEMLSDGPRIGDNVQISDAAKKSAFEADGDGGLNKRGDADVPKCIENFDIHKDKIIRTTDSRAMGAKYLNEMDLDTREECLRLCCETENCDVFVYEEKNAGSCYLFQCGPPEDFKCKFTHHVNYTSAINRHLLDLESQIKLTKHEQELTKLRKPEILNTGNVDIIHQQVTTRATTTTSKPTTMMAQVQQANAHPEDRRTDAPPTIPNKRCSPYQFECRSTGECIGIYNACDGIPQCADGSDEGPELKCPDSTTPPSPLVQQHQQMPSAEVQQLQPINVPQNNPYQRQQMPPKQPDNRQSADFLRPVADPLNPMQNSAYDPQQLNAQFAYIPAGQPNWEHSMQPQQQKQQQQAQLQPQHLNQYSNKNSHIFNHKENGLQVPDISDTSQLQYAPDARDSARMPNYYGADIYNQPIAQIPQQIPENNWAHNNNPADYRGNGMYANQDMNTNGREIWSQPNIPISMIKNDANAIIYSKPATKELLTITDEKEIPKHEQEKIANDLKKSKEHFAETNKNLNTKSTGDTMGHKQNGKYHTEYKIAAEALEAIEDGIAETQSGAVLSLTLGLILTALMAILIGCRLRVVRRRLRRGGKSYAHDADYLVNGMYL